MEIRQAWSHYVEGHGHFQDHWQIIGLGDDNRVYMWDLEDGEWSLHRNQTPVPKPVAPVGSPSNPINLDDIPF